MTKLPEIFLIREQLGVFNVEPSLNKNLYILTKDLDLTNRTLNVLAAENIVYVGDLVQYTEKSLSKLPNMGAKSLYELVKTVSELSLYMGMNIVNWPPEELKETQYQKEGLHSTRILLNFDQLNFLTKNLRDINLPVRACNALLNLGCNNMSDLLFTAVRELKRTPNFGNSSLEDIEELLKSYNIKLGDSLDPWDDDIVKEVRSIIDEEINKRRSETKTTDQFLEDELIRILNESIYTSKKESSSRDRVINVLINRFGLDGSPGKTLEIIGQKYNVTRERIRQNQEFGLRKLRASRPLTPILNRVFEELLKALPVTEIEFNRILKEKKITLVEWDFKGLQDFYENLGNKLDFYYSVGRNPRIITNSLNNNFKNLVLKVTNKKISSVGLFSVSDCMNLKDIYLNDIKKETVKGIIQTKELFTWLDEEENYFTYFSNRNRLSNLITKAAEGSKIVNIDGLFKSVKNYHRLSKEVDYDKKVFIKFCQNSFNCAVLGDDLLFENSQSKMSNYSGYKGKVIAPNEQKIIDIFKNYGPILDWSDLKELSRSSDVKEDSLNMMMQFSVLFQRIDRSTYILANEKYNLENIKSYKIDISKESFSKNECEYLVKETAYVDVYNYGNFKDTLNYPRPLRKVLDKYRGVTFDDKVYVISETD